MGKPYLVIAGELVALICAKILAFYQRYVGKMSGSLALIPPSIDSKNHVYVAGTVILSSLR